MGSLVDIFYQGFERRLVCGCYHMLTFGGFACLFSYLCVCACVLGPWKLLFSVSWVSRLLLFGGSTETGSRTVGKLGRNTQKSFSNQGVAGGYPCLILGFSLVMIIWGLGREEEGEEEILACLLAHTQTTKKTPHTDLCLYIRAELDCELWPAE